MKVSGCQNCPLMKFNMIDTKCTCRYFYSITTRFNVVDPFVIDYTEKGQVKERITIPAWCGLVNKLCELVTNRITFKVFRSSVLVDENDSEVDLEVIDAAKLMNHESALLDNFLLQLNGRPQDQKFEAFNPEALADGNDTKYTDFEEVGALDNRIDFNATYGYQTPVVKQDVCSLCGCSHETVKRDKNIGMCDTCWELYKNDEDKKKQAFINNFRMKRDKDFRLESFKLIDDIKIV